MPEHMKKVELTPTEAETARKLLRDAQGAAPGNLRVYNLCRRVLYILHRAERRRLRVRHSVNRLLLQPEVINDIFNTQYNG